MLTRAQGLSKGADGLFGTFEDFSLGKFNIVVAKTSGEADVLNGRTFDGILGLGFQENCVENGMGFPHQLREQGLLCKDIKLSIYTGQVMTNGGYEGAMLYQVFTIGQWSGAASTNDPLWTNFYALQNNHEKYKSWKVKFNEVFDGVGGDETLIFDTGTIGHVVPAKHLNEVCRVLEIPQDKCIAGKPEFAAKCFGSDTGGLGTLGLGSDPTSGINPGEYICFDNMIHPFFTDADRCQGGFNRLEIEHIFSTRSCGWLNMKGNYENTSILGLKYWLDSFVVIFHEEGHSNCPVKSEPCIAVSEVGRPNTNHNGPKAQEEWEKCLELKAKFPGISLQNC